MSDTARNEETNQIDKNRNGANGRTAPKPPTAGLRPRAARRQRNAAKSVRGLPDISIIRDLATIYLKEQRRHWPKFVRLGFLPDPAQAEAVTAMAETFCDRHTSGALPDVDPALLKQGPKLAASYSRYSCDNSSPSSVADQVVNELRKAKEEGRFIPWEYCLADYAVSGLERTPWQTRTGGSTRFTSTTSPAPAATTWSGGGSRGTSAATASGSSAPATDST